VFEHVWNERGIQGTLQRHMPLAVLAMVAVVLIRNRTLAHPISFEDP
jgi:hypothetical protein